MSKEASEPTPAPPPRVAVFVARDAPRAVILRRGPTKWTHVVLWHLDTDTFELGAWTKGKLKPHSCDLSPDGQLFVYTIQNYGQRQHPASDHWTAVSRPPWIKALALWPHDCFDGGGRFTEPRALTVSVAEVIQTDREGERDGDISEADRWPLETTYDHYERSDDKIEFADSWRGHDHENREIWIEDGRVWRSDMPEDRMLLV